MKVWVFSHGCIYEGGRVINVYGSRALAVHEAVVHMFKERLHDKHIFSSDVTFFKLTRKDDSLYYWEEFHNYEGISGEPFATDYVELKAFTI